MPDDYIHFPDPDHPYWLYTPSSSMCFYADRDTRDAAWTAIMATAADVAWPTAQGALCRGEIDVFWVPPPRTEEPL
jgi:hypothetical protein